MGFLRTTAADVDSAVTNLAVLLEGATIGSGNGNDTPLSPTLGLDVPDAYTFTARAQDNQGGTSWATQEVALVTQPLHVLTAGFRTNGAFKLCLAGKTNKNYQLLGSVDLGSTNWTVLGVMESTNGIWRLLDAGAATNQWRFYRVEQLP